MPVGTVGVTLVADPTVRRRSVRVDARMDDQEAGPATRPAAPIGSTEPLPRIQRPQPAPQAGQTVVLTLEDGRQVPVATARCGSGGRSTTTW